MVVSKLKTLIKNREDILSLLFVFIFALIIGSLLVYINSTSNILGHSYRDIYLYLIEALRFAGFNISGYRYVNYLSPLLPFITSLFFRLGFIGESTIFIVTGVFYVFGVLGLYLLLKLRFNNIYSIFGSVLYASFSINLMWAGNGTIDVPCACLSIWTVYFFIQAMKNNQRYFYIALPFAILTCFAKYTGAVIIEVLILYFLSQNDILGNIKLYFKNLIGGVIVSILLIIPFFYFYWSNKLPLGFLSQAQTISSTTTLSASSISHNRGNNLFYYFTNLPRFMYNPNHIIPIILIIITAIGMIFGVYKFYNILINSNNENKSTFSFLFKSLKINKTLVYIIMSISIIGMIFSFLLAGTLSFVKCEVLFYLGIFIFSLSFNSILKEYNNEKIKYSNFNYDLIMIAWFMGHIIFLSAHLTKVDRYATAFAPTLAFFITYSLKSICDSGKFKKNVGKYLPFIFIGILIFLSFAYLTIDKHDSLVDDEKYTANWLENNNSIDSIVVWSDRGPIYTWYLQKEIHYVTDRGNVSELSENMLDNNVEYYVSQEKNLNIPSYELINQFGKVSIYQRVY